MRHRRSNWYVPKDWAFLIKLHLLIPTILVVAGCLVPVVVRVRQGDLTLFWFALACALIGIALLSAAKWPLYRQGKYLTFGSKALPKGCRTVYRIAYVFISGSSLTLLLSLAVLR